MGVDGPAQEVGLHPHQASETPPQELQQVYGIAASVPVLQINALPAGQRLTGPCILVDPVSTVFVAPGWSGRVDAIGNVLLSRKQDQA